MPVQNQYIIVQGESRTAQARSNILPRGPGRVVVGEDAPLEDSSIFLFAIVDFSKVRSNGAIVVERAIGPAPDPDLYDRLSEPIFRGVLSVVFKMYVPIEAVVVGIMPEKHN